MTCLALLTVCLAIQQVGSYGDLLSGPRRTPFSVTPNVAFFNAEFDYSGISKGLKTIRKTVKILEKNPSYMFSKDVIASFETRHEDTKGHLERALGRKLPRTRRDADDGDIISYSQCFVGSVVRTIGLSSKCDIDDLGKQLRSIQNDFEQTDKTISTRLEVLDKSLEDSISSIYEAFSRKVNETEGFHDKHLSLSVELEGLFSHLDQMVKILYEIRDRADKNLPPRNIISVTTIQQWMEQATDQYPGYFPMYQDPELFFGLAYSLTFSRHQKFIVKFAMPLQEKREFFFKKQETRVFSILESTTTKVQLTHGQETECHESASAKNIVCIVRSCRMDKYSKAVRTCLLTSSSAGEDIVEVVYNKTYMQNRGIEKLILNCPLGFTQVIEVKSEILKITLPVSCSLKNSQLNVERIVTTNPVYNTKQIEYKNYSLEMGAQILFHSEGTNLEIKKIVAEEDAEKEKMEAEKKRQEHRNKHQDDAQSHHRIGIIVFGVVLFVFVIVFSVCGFLLYKKRVAGLREQGDEKVVLGAELKNVQTKETQDEDLKAVVITDRESDSKPHKSLTKPHSRDQFRIEEEEIEYNLHPLHLRRYEELSIHNDSEVELEEVIRSEELTISSMPVFDVKFEFEKYLDNSNS